MRNEYSVFPFCQHSKTRIQIIFGTWIKRSSRFIKDDYGSLLTQCPCKCDFLRFTSGRFEAMFVKLTIDIGVDPTGQGLRSIPQAGFVY